MHIDSTYYNNLIYTNKKQWSLYISKQVTSSLAAFQNKTTVTLMVYFKTSLSVGENKHMTMYAWQKRDFLRISNVWINAN